MKALVLLATFIMLSALLSLSMNGVANAQSAGVFTSVSIKVYDQVLNQTSTYTGCIIDESDLHYVAPSAGGPNNSLSAQCDSASTVAGVTAPQYPAGVLINFKTVAINTATLQTPAWFCRLVVDDTTYYANLSAPHKSYSDRQIAFRCTDGST